MAVLAMGLQTNYELSASTASFFEELVLFGVYRFVVSRFEAETEANNFNSLPLMTYSPRSSAELILPLD